MFSGGKAASKLVEADHQTFKDASVNALVKNWQTKEPLVLIADDRYERFPFDLTRGQDGGKGYAYVVLGYYFIRHFWGQCFPLGEREYDTHRIPSREASRRQWKWIRRALQVRVPILWGG